MHALPAAPPRAGPWPHLVRPLVFFALPCLALPCLALPHLLHLLEPGGQHMLGQVLEQQRVVVEQLIGHKLHAWRAWAGA